ncbi:MAG: hypothetical protein COB41_00095 [Proteobacteria bacterium]|nr:MAG: hypothetical protein COB41_00095 [Pseudomonadota bacterium]
MIMRKDARLKDKTYSIGDVVRDDLTGKYVNITSFEGDSKSMILILDNEGSKRYNKGKRRPWEITKLSVERM